MQTRTTHRKTINLAARYFTGLGNPVDVVISDVSVGGCRFGIKSSNLMLGSRLQMFIESSGPHHATVKWTEGEEVGVTFANPLSEEHVAKFKSSHVPACEADRRAGIFDEMPKALPNRFC